MSVPVSVKRTPRQPPCQEGALDVTVLVAPQPVRARARQITIDFKNALLNGYGLTSEGYFRGGISEGVLDFNIVI